MRTIRQSRGGIDYLVGLLKESSRTITRVIFWKIPHKTPREDISLKLGRYNKPKGFTPESPEIDNPRSELTLDYEEFQRLLEFLQENYEPFREGVRKFLPLDEGFDSTKIEHLKAIFENPDLEKLLDFIVSNEILSEELIVGLEAKNRVAAIEEFEKMLAENLVEGRWQEWFERNSWVLGSDFVRILDERDIDTENIADYLVKAYDGFLDIVELKRPGEVQKFWAGLQESGYYSSAEVTKAIAQATRYIYEVEREADSIKFLERVGGTRTVKPRATLILGRSQGWNSEQNEAYRILNSGFHNITILTYDHVLERARRIIGLKNGSDTQGQEK